MGHAAEFDSGDGDWRPALPLEMLRRRGELLGALRAFFVDEGYWEVETPVLSADVCVDTHLEPFVTHTADGREWFLQTSPEFGMKRLLAAGARSIFQVTRAFRADELGPLHNPEFTMVEWYRVGDRYAEQMDLVERLVRRLAEQVEPPLPLDTRFGRVSYDDAFRRVLGCGGLTASAAEFAELARRFDVAAPASLAPDDADGWRNLLLTDVIEPTLGRVTPEFMYDFPASQAALARVRPGPPAVAERFELYIEGVELCNGYQELTDPVEFRRRMETEAAGRLRDGRRELPVDNRLADALEAGMPECSGVAMGFDRLALLLLGGSTLADVQSFPFPRA